MAVLPFRRNQPSSDQVAEQAMLSQARDSIVRAQDIANEVYAEAMLDLVPVPVSLEDRLKGQIGTERRVSGFPGAQTLEGNAFIPPDPQAVERIKRSTGKLLLMETVCMVDPLSEESTESEQRALINIRAAAGFYYWQAYQKLHEDAGKYFDLAGATRAIGIFKLAQQHDPETNEVRSDYVYLTGFTDKTVINELPLLFRGVTNGDREGKHVDYEYAVGFPKEIIAIEKDFQFNNIGHERDLDGNVVTTYYGETLQEIARLKTRFSNKPHIKISEQTKERQTPEKIIRGVIFAAYLLETFGTLNLNDIADEDKRNFHNDDVHCLELLPDTRRSNYTMRMVDFIDRILLATKDKRDSLKQNPEHLTTFVRYWGEQIKEIASYEYALTRILANGNDNPNLGLISTIGLLDPRDPNMRKDYDDLVREVAQRNPEVPRKLIESMVNGLAYISPHRPSPQGASIVRLGEGVSELDDGAGYFNSPLGSGYGKSRGFMFIENAIHEIDKGTGGKAPMMPGILSILSLPTKTNMFGRDNDIYMIVDLMEAPGFLMEKAIEELKQNFVPYTGRSDDYSVTLTKMLRGEYIGSSAGTPAELMARCGHAIVRMAHTTDPDGSTHDSRIETLIPLLSDTRAYYQIKTAKNNSTKIAADQSITALTPVKKPEDTLVRLAQKPLIPILSKRISKTRNRTRTILSRLRSSSSNATNTPQPTIVDTKISLANYVRRFARGDRSIKLDSGLSYMSRSPTLVELFRIAVDHMGVPHISVLGEKNGRAYAKKHNLDPSTLPRTKYITMSAGKNEPGSHS